ncbi:MAG: tetratricopeptide repeat protein [Gemmatimonadetes bacterium]|nr:tetratricopeptide repeat protein [Gemmatimonadota bacterium]
MSRSSARGLLALSMLGFLCSCAGTTSRSGGRDMMADIGDPEEAIQAAQAVLAANPEDSAAKFRLGLAWAKLADATAAGEPQKAFRDSARVALESVIESDPQNVEARVHYGLVLEDLGRLSDAVDQYDQAHEIAPEDPVPLVNKGALLYFNEKKTFEAKEVLMQALALDPDNANAHFNLGVLFADANMFHEAKVEWERVMKVAPEGSPARNLAAQNLDRVNALLEGNTAADSGVKAPDDGHGH